MIHIDLDWKDHPVRRRGLYTSKRGVLEILDKSYQFGQTYRFVLDGRTRSPYYDAECVRLTKQRVAIELDKDYAGASSRFFDGELIARLLKESARDPEMRFSCNYDPDTVELNLIERPDGDFKTWLRLERDLAGKLIPPRGLRLSLGNDLAAGGGTDTSANSAMVGWDRDTGEQVLGYATNNVKVERFAELAIAVCRFFKGDDETGAFLNWETNGVGGAFTTMITDVHCYGNVYRPPKKPGTFDRGKKEQVGWHSKANDKYELLGGVQGGGLAAALESGRCKPRDVDLIRELANFINDGGRVYHSREKTTDDPGSKGAAHGDRVIAAGTGWLGVSYKPPEDPVTGEPEPPEDSFDYKMAKYEREEAERAGQDKDPYDFG